MFYKKMALTWGLLVSSCLVSIFILSTIIDPIDILGTPLIKGLNNCKVNQVNYLDIFKPYQVVKYDPKVLFVGSSRVYCALEPKLDGYEDQKVYNFAFSALSLKNMEKYLDFVYAVSKPEKVFIGLDFFQFSKENFNDVKNNFSQKRLSILSQNNKELIVLESYKENFQVSYLILNTIKNSFKDKKNVDVFQRGWDSFRGGSEFVNQKEYYTSMNSYMKFYSEWEYEPEAIKSFKRIVDKAKYNDVKIFVFFNPISVDLISLIKLNGLEDDLLQIKKDVVEIVDVIYDFNFINDYTINRFDLYYDASHSNMKFGKLVKKDILAGVDTERMKILNRDCIVDKLIKEKEMNDKWFYDNLKYISYLERKVKSKEKVVQGEISEFIGF